MTRPIIGFAGPIGCGKTTAARVLENIGYTRVRFAGPLKAMLAALGLTPEQIDGGPEHREAPCPLLGGKTSRFALQTLGTEWGRDIISPDLWVNAWRHMVDTLPLDVPVVVDDVRFPNEADVIKSMGGVVVQVKRDGYGVGEVVHRSEQFDFVPTFMLVNDDLEVFKKRVTGIALLQRRLCEDDAA